MEAPRLPQKKLKVHHSHPRHPKSFVDTTATMKGQGSDVEGGELEYVVDKGEKSSSSSSVRDGDI